MMIIEEVHLWRGSAEQRALRSSSQSNTVCLFRCTASIIPYWRGKKVLDFGGNKGNLLLDPTCTIRHRELLLSSM